MKLIFWLIAALVFFAVPVQAKTLRLEVPNGTAQIIFYDQKGKVLKILEDKDHDGFFEKTSLFKNGKLSRTLIDKNHNHIPEEIIIYNAKGTPAEALFDRNEDKKPDKWQIYRNGKLARLEEDRNFDGRKDLVSEFDAKGQVVRMLRDDDHDGFFEIEEKIKGQKREVFVYKPLKPKGRLLITKAIYINGRLEKRFFDKDEDGTLELEELLRPDGNRCVLLALKKNEAFFYAGKKPFFGLRDTDKDGSFDQAYSYRERRWIKIAPITREEIERLCTQKPQDILKRLKEAAK